MKSKLWPSLACLMSGAILALALAPFNFYIIAFISPAVLLWVWLRSTPWQATYRGFLFGVGFFGLGTSWIYISIHHFGQASALLSTLITGLLISYLALYFALQGYLSRRIYQHKPLLIQSLCVFPALWLIMEVLRAWLFTGFPWLLLGYSQLNTPLKSLAPLFSVYGVSMITCLISGALVILVIQAKIAYKLLAIVIIIMLLGIGWVLKDYHWTKPTGTRMAVSLVQGNIAQKIKWDPDTLRNTLLIYKNMTSKLSDNQLIVWPEAAMPTYPEAVRYYYNSMSQLAKKKKSYLIIGSLLYNPNIREFYNGLSLIGLGQGIYYKRHLVPFGEYTPLKSIFGTLMEKLNIPMSNFIQGPDLQKSLHVKNINIAPFICYEIAFPFEVLSNSKNTQLLINISDDSWFGDSIALDQQIQMTQFRALETGRPILSSTNTGITAIINASGKMTHSLPIDQRQTLTGYVQPMHGKTPLMRWSSYSIIILIMLLLALSLWSCC